MSYSSGFRVTVVFATIALADHGVVGTAAPPPSEMVVQSGPAADIYRFPLRGTGLARGARGEGVLHPSQSPFGIAVSRDGHLVYDLEVSVTGIVPAQALGGNVYTLWTTTPELDRIEKIGVLPESGSLSVTVSGMNKFILLMTLEASADVEQRSGPVVVRGVSPSGLLISFNNHELFSNMPHEE